MLQKFFTLFCVASTLFFTVSAKPTAVRRHPQQLNKAGDDSLANVTSIPSLAGFENFFGPGNFNGNQNQKTIIQKKTVQCQQQDVTLIQQRLTVLREMVKKVVIQQVCEVEVQTTVLEQFKSGVESFTQDVRHVTTRQISFDESITTLFSQIQDSLGNLSDHDLGFQGSNVGNSSVIATGSNWNDQTSPASLGAVYNATVKASKKSNSQSNAASSAAPAPTKSA